MVKEKSFLFRVRQALPDLHPAEKRVGEFVCDFPGELASYSAQELAALAHVSKATVTRFIQRLGYDSYEEARGAMRGRRNRPARASFWNAPTRAKQCSPLKAHAAQDIANIEATFLAISDRQIESAADCLLQARKVWVIGFRSSQPFAAYFQWQLTQVIENIVAIPGPGQTLGEHFASLQDADIVVVFAMRRRVAQIDAILDHVKASEAKLIYVTDEGGTRS